MVVAHRRYCEKRTKRGQVCGQELNANTTCPRGYLHADAPRYPWLWPPVILFTLSAAVALSFAFGVFLFIGPFVNGSGATVGPVGLTQGSTLTLGAGEQVGFYEIAGCDGTLRDPSVRMATLVGGGGTYAIYPVANPPYFSERPLLLPFDGVRQCATFTAPRAATYTIAYASRDASELGVVPSTELYRVTIYHAILWLSLAMLVSSGVYLALVLRRRRRASDPTQTIDITHDPIAQAAWRQELWEHGATPSGTRPDPPPTAR